MKVQKLLRTAFPAVAYLAEGQLLKDKLTWNKGSLRVSAKQTEDK